MPFTACVPDHGLVDWDLDAILAHARALEALHTQSRRLLTTPTCAACGQGWPCNASRWATRQTGGDRDE